MSSSTQQGRRHSRLRTNGEGKDNNAGAMWGMSDRDLLLDGGKGDTCGSQQVDTTFIHDIWIAMRSHWRAGLLVGSGCGILALAVVLLQTHDHGNPMRNNISVIGRDWSFNGWNGRKPQFSIATPRPIPTSYQQVNMRDMYMHASVTLQLSEKEDDEKGMNKNMLAAVTLQGSQKAGDIGHIKLPLSFYEGIHFGISAWNPWGNASSISENTRRSSELRKTIEDTLALHSLVFVYNATWKWDLNVWEGFVLYCNLTTSGKYKQNDRVSYNNEEFTSVPEVDTCSGVESQVMDLARAYQQFVVYKWYPHVWGSSSDGIDTTDPHHYTSIIQNVIPTRTGWSLIRTNSVVYESVTGTVKEL